MNRAKCKASPRIFVANLIVTVYDASSNVVSSALETILGLNSRERLPMCDQARNVIAVLFGLPNPCKSR